MLCVSSLDHSEVAHGPVDHHFISLICLFHPQFNSREEYFETIPKCVWVCVFLMSFPPGPTCITSFMNL